MEENLSVWLIGRIESTFPDGLVTVRDVLRVYYYYRRKLSKTKLQSVHSVAQDLIIHWNNLGVCTMVKRDIVQKINKFIDQYDSCTKNMHRESQTQKINERKFVDQLNERMEIKKKAARNRKIRITRWLLSIRKIKPSPSLGRQIVARHNERQYGTAKQKIRTISYRRQ